MIEFTLPALGADMDEGTMLEWKIKPGDRVSRGMIVAVVDTSKAALDIEAWHDATVAGLLVQPGETVPVGTPLAIFTGPDEDPAAALRAYAERPVSKSVAITPLAPQAGPAPARVPAVPPPTGRERASPAARRRARELGVELAGIAGSGPHGAITLADIEAAVRAPAAKPDKAAQMRRTIAAAMSRSKREIPHYYLAEDIPLLRAFEWLTAENCKRTIADRVLPAALLLKAVALALAKYPELNGFYRHDAFEPGGGIHIGVAVALRQGGLVAPAIHHVDRLPLVETMRALLDLVRRARAGSLRASELTDPTVTVTSLGDDGVKTVFGVINPPQVALVGYGRIAERPHATGGTVIAAPMVTATLAADHRVSDGHSGARFLAELRDLLQQPEVLQ